MKAIHAIRNALCVCALAMTALLAADQETLSLDCGGGVALDLVKIPAGTFIMGARDPDHPTGYFLLWSYALAALVALIAFALIVRTIIKKKRFQISIRMLLLLTALAGTGLGMYLKELDLRNAWASVRRAFENEKPAHEVELTQPFYLGKFEVTQEQYQAVMGINPSSIKGPNLPVDSLLWENSQEFCKKLSEKTGSTVRLPTEAEWEYACRAGSNNQYYAGNDISDLHVMGWFNENAKHKLHPVGTKKPNAWGLYDMLGNVSEFCGDYSSEYQSARQTDPIITKPNDPKEPCRIVRGGGCFDFYCVCRTTARSYREKGDPGEGFRVLVEAKAPTVSK